MIVPAILQAVLITFVLTVARSPLPGGGLGPIPNLGAKLAFTICAGVVSVGAGIAWVLGRPRGPGAAVRLLIGVVLFAPVLTLASDVDGTLIGAAVISLALIASAFAFDRP